MSNNNEERVALFAQDLEIDFYHSSRKPLKKNFEKILEDNKVLASQVCLIGDQLLTDVFGCYRMKMMSIYVEPLADRDIFYTKVNRFFERKVLKSLERRKIFKIGEYYE